MVSSVSATQHPPRHRSSPNETVHPPGPLQRRGVARNKNAAPVGVQRLVRPQLAANSRKLANVWLILFTLPPFVGLRKKPYDFICGRINGSLTIGVTKPLFCCSRRVRGKTNTFGQWQEMRGQLRRRNSAPRLNEFIRRPFAKLDNKSAAPFVKLKGKEIRLGYADPPEMRKRPFEAALPETRNNDQLERIDHQFAISDHRFLEAEPLILLQLCA